MYTLPKEELIARINDLVKDIQISELKLAIAEARIKELEPKQVVEIRYMCAHPDKVENGLGKRHYPLVDNLKLTFIDKKLTKADVI